MQVPEPWKHIYVDKVDNISPYYYHNSYFYCQTGLSVKVIPKVFLNTDLKGGDTEIYKLQDADHNFVQFVVITFYFMFKQLDYDFRLC